MQPNIAARDHLFSQRKAGMSLAGCAARVRPLINGIANVRKRTEQPSNQ